MKLIIDRRGGNSRHGNPLRGPNLLNMVAVALCAIVAGETFADELGSLDPMPTASLDAGYSVNEGGGDELLLFTDVEVVYSASRREQASNLLAVPVSIITADDIHYSGLTDLPMMLRQVPGMDVLRSDRNNYSFGVRGLHHGVSDRTLVLIDGRSAGLGIQGGADFGRLPLFPEDIARIEVVRGPGGATWGANAFNGVINIITKKPEDVIGVFISSQVNHFGDTYNHLRWGHQIDEWSWRLSAGYESFKSSDEAINNDRFKSNDHARTWRFDTQAVFTPSDQSKVTFGVAGSDVTRGDYEFMAAPAVGAPRTNELIHTLRAFARVDHEIGPDESLYVQWFGNYSDGDRATLWDVQSFETDLEAQYNVNIGEDHQFSIGGNGRLTRIKAVADTTISGLPDDTSTEAWLGLFAIDRWQLTERLTLETQARVDWYSESQIDWSGRLSGLYELDEESRHVLRASAAKSFRAPMYLMQRGSTQRVHIPSPPAPPGTFGLTLLPADNLTNEQIWSLEGGYNGRLTEEITVGVDGYYQIYEDLIGGGAFPAGFPGTNIIQLQNIGGATAYGAELQATWEQDNLRLTAWYAYNGFDDEFVNQSMRAFRPAPHKVGVTGRLAITTEMTANVNYRYTGWTPNDRAAGSSFTAPNAKPMHAVDATLSLEIPDWHAEIMVGVLDILGHTGDPVQQIGSITSHDTPGRTAFMRLQFNF
jgi:outer membrane receptor protein involved in Fe transport